MGRTPCCSKVGLQRGPWTATEDSLLTKYIKIHGEGHWRSLANKAGLLRCEKSCRLRWMNYLRPDIKRGNITPDEEDLVIKLHALLGNRWSLIAGRLPGRTDNEIKNYWNTRLSKKNIDPRNNVKYPKKIIDPLVQDPKTNIKRKCNSSNKNQIKNKLKTNVETVEKITVHNPKPIRLTSLYCFSMLRNNSFDWSNPSGFSKHEGEKKIDKQVDDVPRFSENVIGFDSFISDVLDDELVNGSFFLCQSPVSTCDYSTLEKLYEEYLQLLKTEENEQVQLDSSTESLCI